MKQLNLTEACNPHNEFGKICFSLQMAINRQVERIGKLNPCIILDSFINTSGSWVIVYEYRGNYFRTVLNKNGSWESTDLYREYDSETQTLKNKAS